MDSLSLLFQYKVNVNENIKTYRFGKQILKGKFDLILNFAAQTGSEFFFEASGSARLPRERTARVSRFATQIKETRREARLRNTKKLDISLARHD